jgi:hypothetical protein
MDIPHSQKINGVSIFFLTLIFFLLSGCSSDTSPQPPYIPPKPDYQPTEQTSSTLPPQLPVPTVQSIPTPMLIDCSENLLYIDDITFPDWTNIEPGKAIDKQWQVENNGTCDWDYRYSLRLISGESLGAEIRQGLYPARAGSQTIIQISFITPLRPGTYHSIWQAYNPSDQPFGDPISILVVVVP